MLRQGPVEAHDRGLRHVVHSELRGHRMGRRLHVVLHAARRRVRATQAAHTSLGLTALMVVGNMTGWFFVEYFGRQGTALWVTAILCAALFLIGILASIPVPGTIWGQIAFMGIWSFSKFIPGRSCPIPQYAESNHG